jgi:hypothetical protein
MTACPLRRPAPEGERLPRNPVDLVYLETERVGHAWNGPWPRAEMSEWT